MKDIINKLISHKTLSKDEAKSILINISSGKFNNSLISSFLTVFMMRNITLEELQGFKEALLELCISIDLSDYNTIDLCGTGGDNKDTFNISTLSIILLSYIHIYFYRHTKIVFDSFLHLPPF